LEDGLPTANSRLPEIFEKREQEITDQWLERQQATGRKLSAAEREQAAGNLASLCGHSALL